MTEIEQELDSSRSKNISSLSGVNFIKFLKEKKNRDLKSEMVIFTFTSLFSDVIYYSRNDKPEITYSHS